MPEISNFNNIWTKIFFTMKIYLCGGLGLRPVRITPTHWVGRISARQATPWSQWSHKFRI